MKIINTTGAGALLFTSFLASCGGNPLEKIQDKYLNDPEAEIVNLVEEESSSHDEPEYVVAKSDFSGETQAFNDCTDFVGCGAYRIGEDKDGNLLGQVGFEVTAPDDIIAPTTESTYYSNYVVGHGENSAGSKTFEQFEGTTYIIYDPENDKFSTSDDKDIIVDAVVDGKDFSGTFTYKPYDVSGELTGYIDEESLIGAMTGELTNHVIAGYLIGSNMAN